MSGPDETTVRRLFDHAASLEPEARKELLERTRREDPILCDEVESLLRFHEADEGLLDRGAAAVAAAGLARAGTTPGAAPSRIGAYAIVSELGRGGMGVVYEAQQQTPSRHVALKVIRPDAVTEGMLRRFAREAEVLGLLHHPGIAQVYEAGTAPDDRGVPRTFIAMELVRGRSLASVIRKGGLGVDEALGLVVKVADAVDHAHRRGVIHRDLKPANILIESEGAGTGGTPKVLDFGIARLGEYNPAVTAETHAGQVVGTLAYMSPEQAGGDPRRVDTRSDVYSLGAVLYELLGGRPPIDLTGATITQAVTSIREREPELLGAISARLRGDIEAIVAKALEKDPAHRYASAAEFAADIHRHLADQPVLARAPSTLYQLRKFARRNRALVAGATAVAAALCIGVAGTAWQAIRATREKERASQQFERAQATAGFLRRMLRSATPEGSGGREITVREVLDSAAQELSRTGAAMAPLVAAETHLVLAESYFALGDFGKAAEHAEQGRLAAVRGDGELSEQALAAAAFEGRALANLTRGEEALALVLPLLERARAEYGSDHPAVLDLLQAAAAGHIRLPGPKTDAAEVLAREAVERGLRLFGPEDERTAYARQTLAYVLGFRDDKEKLKEAIGLARAVLDVRIKSFGPEHPRAILTAKDLGRLLHRAGDPAGSLEVMEPMLPVARRVLGPDHMVTLSFETGMAESLDALGRPAETLPLLEHSYQCLKARLGVNYMDTVLTRHQYARLLLSAGKCDRAAEILTEQEAAKAVFGEGHFEPSLSYMWFQLAQCRGETEEMVRLADRLRGTAYEDRARAAVEAARQAGRGARPGP